MHPYHSHSKLRLSGLFISVGLLAAVGLGWLFRQDIADWYRLRQYDAPADVVALAEQDTFTDEGRRIFYTTHPDITGKDEFNTRCRQGAASEYSIVLGCYISNGGLYGDMYLYDIDDQRLNGVVQVTAAHEMLHAAYDRLSTKERERIDRLLNDSYERLPEGRIKETIAQYRANDPAAVPSELHSILGTELAELPAELEKYYRQYFSNRSTIVGFSEQYEGEFTQRQNQVTRYEEQLATMKVNIEANQREIDSRAASLKQQQAELDKFEAEGDAAAFNARVGSYNQQVAGYNALVEQTRADIAEHNRFVEELNNLVLEVKELYQAINSQPETL